MDFMHACKEASANQLVENNELGNIGQDAGAKQFELGNCHWGRVTTISNIVRSGNDLCNFSLPMDLSSSRPNDNTYIPGTRPNVRIIR